LLNVTLQYLKSDQQSVLAYARKRRITAVMSFAQGIRPDYEHKMLVMTEALIDRVIDLGSTVLFCRTVYMRATTKFMQPTHASTNLLSERDTTIPVYYSAISCGSPMSRYSSGGMKLDMARWFLINFPPLATSRRESQHRNREKRDRPG